MLQGGDDTFGSFPEQLRALVSHASPKVNVVAITYPQYETRGDLQECVGRFREWLENKVIDLEVATYVCMSELRDNTNDCTVRHRRLPLILQYIQFLLATLWVASLLLRHSYY